MNDLSTELDELIDTYFPKLDAIAEGPFSEKPLPGKWSKKEILGHLIDSAQNNIRRFVVAQYEEEPLIIYKQNLWVEINNYQSYPPHLLTDLWYLQNKQMVRILHNLTTEMLSRNCKSEAIHTVEWLALDYIKHLQHHMHVILDMDGVAYP